MRNVFSQLGRAVSIVAVVVLLTTPTSRGAGLLPDRDGGSGRVWGSIHRIVHAVKTWFGSGIADDMIIPRP
jgi:hypothetical protein